MALADNIAPARAALHSPVAPRAELRRRRDAAADLAEALAGRLAGEVRFDAASRALYATDLSIYRQVPIGVVIPKSVEDVEAALAACRERQVPVLPRGCGTSLSGQTCNVAVVL
ncbi:MAG TPA: FAD-binding protein, partial [Stellaceae bacterium]|nr:FAD-binding protein [Stellaceae bacterium]